MANGKGRLYTESEVNQIVRKRLARAKQPNGDQIIPAQQVPYSVIPAYRVTRLPWATDEPRATEPELTEEEEEAAYEAERRAESRKWWRKESARLLREGMPDHPGERWLIIAEEAINYAQEEVDELRANNGEQRAIDDIQDTIDKLSDLRDKVEAARDALMVPVMPEIRATKEQEKEIIAKFAFLPESEREAIKARILQEEYYRLNPADLILRRCFERKEL